MPGIFALLAAAAIAYALARTLRLPAIPLLLLAGTFIGGVVEAELLGNALILGVTFLLFVAGIELGFAETRGYRRRAVLVGTVQFLVLGAAGFLAALGLGIGAEEAAFLGLALTASSALVVVRLLRQRRQMYEPFARLLVGVLLLQNLLVLALIPVLTRWTQGPLAVGTGILGVGALLGLAAAVGRWVTPHLIRLDREDEPLLLAVLAILFVFLGAADFLGLPLAAGAFLAGVALARFPASALVRPQLEPINDFFAATFFTALGAQIGLPGPVETVRALLLVALVVVLTPPLVTWIGERAGLSARPAIEAGLLLAQTSELSLVIGLYGLLEGQIDDGLFTTIALVTFLTMLLTPVVARDRVAWTLLHLHPTRRRLQPTIAPPAGDHVLVLGSGTTGLPLLETLFASGCDVVVVDDDPTVIDRLREAEVPVIRGDATDLAVLEEARARSARMVVSTIRRPEDNRRLLEHVRGVPVLVRVFEDDDAAWVRELGGTPVLYSDAAAEGLLDWYDRKVAAASGPGGSAAGGTGASAGSRAEAGS